MALVEVKVPDIGDFDEVTVIELLVKPGDTIAPEQSLITVESDKASMEIPSSHAGVIKELKVALGDKVKQGSIVLTIESAGSAQAPAAQQPAASASASAPAPTSAAASAPSAAAPVAEGVAQPADGTFEIHVPDIGDFTDVAVIELLVNPGDTIKPEQSLITVESDKAAMEIPASSGGVLKELKVKIGDKVNQGDLLAILEGAGGAAAPVSAPASAPTPAAATTAAAASQDSAAKAPSPQAVAAPGATKSEVPAHDPGTHRQGLPHASPSVRKFARELGVPLDEMTGSGPKGRITQEDVQGFTRSVMAGAAQTKAASAKAPAASNSSGAGLDLLPWPKVDFAKFGEVERKDMSRIKKISGANLHRNWVMIPHVTHHDDSDITELEAFRVATNKENEKAGIKITMLAFMIKAAVAGLKQYPEFNSSLEGDQLVLKKYFHIGFAADTPNGLVVPVIRDCDKKGVMQISKEMGELAKKARDGKMGPADMSGACFSISSLGGIGVKYFSPIINAPEVAIMGVGTSTMEPRWDGKQFMPRLVLPLSLSYDHRVIDGASGARFATYFSQLLSDFRRVLL